jgi:hypothetical protein
MNYYVVVEGRSGEKRVYPKWISLLNPSLKEVHSVNEIGNDNYLIISGNGYPSYMKIIDNAIEDCSSYAAIDFLVVAVDAEDFTYQAKKTEILAYIGDRLPPQKVKVIVQFPCLENWALGNRVVCKRNPQDARLRKYLRAYDVRVYDPEGLPPFPDEDLNRCQFAFVYLKRILNDRHPSLTYTKSNPVVIEHEKYFEQMRKRLEETGHIVSFRDFLETFSVAV